CAPTSSRASSVTLAECHVGCGTWRERSGSARCSWWDTGEKRPGRYENCVTTRPGISRDTPPAPTPAKPSVSFPASRNSMTVSPRSTSTNPTRAKAPKRSEEHTSELQSRFDLVCRLLHEKKKNHHLR